MVKTALLSDAAAAVAEVDLMETVPRVFSPSLLLA
jgi:hypothetical protein